MFTVIVYDENNHPHDLSADVTRAEWRLGCRRPYQSVADPATARLTLLNRDRQHTPEAAPAAPWQIGRRVQIRHTDDTATTRTLFTGWVTLIEPQAGDHSTRETVVHLACGLAELARMVITTPLMTNARTSEIIQTVLARPPLWRYPHDIPPGDSLLAFAGDRWGEGVIALRAIRQATSAERGRFYSARDGTLTFRNRAALRATFTPLATFTDRARELRYRYGAALATVVRVKLMPRAVGAPGTPLWTLGGAQKIPPGEQEIVVRYRDDTGRPAGALDVLPPVPGTDFQTNTAPDGSGIITTLFFSMSVLSADGASARLLLNNAYTAPVYLLPGAQLRGTPLTSGDPATVERVHLPSLDDYGVYTLTLDLPLLDSVEVAEQIARYELRRRRIPRGAVHTLTLDGRSPGGHAVALTLHDPIRIVETQTAHAADYLIVGEAHTVEQGGARHRVTWTLEPCNTVAYWQLNLSRLDQTAALAY